MGAQFNHTDGFACNVSIPESLISAARFGVLPGEMGEVDFNTHQRDGWILIIPPKKRKKKERQPEKTLPYEAIILTGQCTGRFILPDHRIFL